MRLLRKHGPWSVPLLSAAVLAGCTDGTSLTDDTTSFPGDSRPVNGSRETTQETKQPLLGNPIYAGDCTATDKVFLDEVMRDGRIAAASTAFVQCIERAMRWGASEYYGGVTGPYYGCNGDPVSGRELNVQIQQAVDTARSLNDVSINCTGGAGNASTYIGVWGHTSPEALWFSGWLHSVDANYTPGAAWPQSQAAEIIWHEASHTQGYGHGDNTDNVAAQAACGTTSVTGWHFQRNTIPYLTGQCLADVLYRSDAMCTGSAGPKFRDCAPNGLGIISSYPGTVGACSCVKDPRPSGLVLIGSVNTAVGKRFNQLDRIPDGSSIGWWRYDPVSNNISGSGYFLGRSAKRQQFVIQSPWGFGLEDFSPTWGLSEVTGLAWGTSIGSFPTTSGSSVSPLGNIDGDSSQTSDLVIKTANGVGFVARNPSGGLDLLRSYNYGEWMGWWHLGSDNVVGDRNGVGNYLAESGVMREEFTIRSGWGFGVLRFDESRNINTVTGVAWGQSLGGWTFRNTDKLVASADFDANGYDDLLFTGSGGLAVFRGADFAPLDVKLYGQSMGWWRFGSADTVVGVGKFDNDNYPDFLIRSAWGIGFISRASGTLQAGGGYAFPATITSAPGRGLDPVVLDANMYVWAVGDFDGNGFTDILVVPRTNGIGGRPAVLGRSSAAAPPLEVLAEYPAGNFTLSGEWDSTGGYLPTGLKPVDYDGDGAADIVTRALQVRLK